VRLWTSAEGASGAVVPVALRWPVGSYFAAQQRRLLVWSISSCSLGV
jgi:hypothetical protein